MFRSPLPHIGDLADIEPIKPGYSVGRNLDRDYA